MDFVYEDLTNRERDAAVAEIVMNWKKGDPQRMPGDIEFDSWRYTKEGRAWSHYDWSPTSNIEQAYQVAKHLQYQGFTVHIELWPDGTTAVSICDNEPLSQLSYARHQISAYAICEAAVLGMIGLNGLPQAIGTNE